MCWDFYISHQLTDSHTRYSFEDSQLNCSQEKGVYLSIAATVIFFVAACCNCCSPHADPFCYNFGQRDKPATKRRVKEPGQTTIVLQPVVIQTDAPNKSNNSNNNDDNDAPESPSKKKKRVVKKKKPPTMSDKV
jgi:hypothetical protein